MSSPLKILFIPKWYPSRVHALNGNFIKRHALAIAMKHSVAILFVSADSGMKDKIYDTDVETDQGITTVRIFYSNSSSGFFPLSSFLIFFRYLKSCRMGIKIIREKFGKPDMCHIHVMARTFFIAYYYKLFYNIPFLISEHWSGYFPEDGSYKGFLKKFLTRMAVRKSSALITVSDSLKNAMLAHGLKNNYFVIPNVVDAGLFFPSRQNEKKSKFIFLHVSNMEDRAKNISGIIHAVKKLSEKRNDFEFHFAGDSAERNKWEELSRKFNLLNTILFFHGRKEAGEIAGMMREADAFLLFSNYETNSCVIIESLASGTPVICPSIPALREYINKEMGILVSPHNEHALCDAMVKIMDGKKIIDKQKLHAYAKEHFGYESAAEKFDTVYQHIFEEQHPCAALPE